MVPAKLLTSVVSGPTKLREELMSAKIPTIVVSDGPAKKPAAVKAIDTWKGAKKKMCGKQGNQAWLLFS